MGIVNATPDSFSDGGALDGVAAAIAHGERLADDGAAWIDVGGESTRPGADPVPAEIELARVVPVIAGLAARLAGRARISVDTSKASVARAALDAGAMLVNDVSAGADPAMLALVAARGAGLILMHRRGSPRDMQRDPRYADVVAEVIAELAARVAAARAAGVAAAAIAVDPGIGFGKSVAHNLALLRAGPRLAAELGQPLVLGVSRKSSLAALAGIELPAAQRDGLSHVAHVALAPSCALLRVHDVAGARAALALAAALRGGDEAGSGGPRA